MATGAVGAFLDVDTGAVIYSGHAHMCQTHVRSRSEPDIRVTSGSHQVHIRFTSGSQQVRSRFTSGSHQVHSRFTAGSHQ
eukprot:3118566-Lingulodinium_polyedra.AAC.1